VIDSDGYRPNVGIILSNPVGEVLWARRIGQDAWQFPQGGIRDGESPEEAMFRELEEELGLTAGLVEIVACTQGWLRYRLPRHLIRRTAKQMCIGQKQIWFMLRFAGEDKDVHLDLSEEPEFDRWRWVEYWYPLEKVVPFKRKVYERALRQFAPLVCGEDVRHCLSTRDIR
jgi:putative (di)nucleoside polyphosphate hydrolase